MILPKKKCSHFTTPIGRTKSTDKISGGLINGIPKATGATMTFRGLSLRNLRNFWTTYHFPRFTPIIPQWSIVPYCNAAATLKNCYLCFKTDTTEDSAYTNTTTGLKDAFDVSHSNSLELSHDVVKADKSFQIFSSQDIEDSHHIYFSQDLIGCSYCIGCVGLRNKNYYIFNEPHSKKDFEKKFLALNLGSWKNRAEFQKKARDFMLKFPHKAMHGRKNSDVSGDYISNSKNVHDSYMVGNGEDARYCQLLKGGPVAKAYDYTQFALNAEWIYDSCWVGINVNNIRFGFWTYNAHHQEYSYGCHGSENLFGCIGIRKGQYCILNKQYSKEEYEALVPKIREQMQKVPFIDSRGREYRYGEYFPSDFCPWAYNESTAHEFFPLSKEEALAQGFRWRDPDQKEYGPATLEAPDHIKEVTDDILKGILKCDDCGRNYQIISMELEFYHKMNIPIPRQCPLCRDRARIKLLNPIKIYNRTCAKCNKPIETSYAPDRPEIVYCETCYQSEVV